jgi:hypothetical protein
MNLANCRVSRTADVVAKLLRWDPCEAVGEKKSRVAGVKRLDGGFPVRLAGRDVAPAKRLAGSRRKKTLSRVGCLRPVRGQLGLRCDNYLRCDAIIK